MCNYRIESPISTALASPELASVSPTLKSRIKDLLLNKFDTDGDGRITIWDLASILASVGEHLLSEAILNIWR